MPAKKTDKSKQKAAPKAVKGAAPKKVDLKAKEKVSAKKSDARASAVEKAKSKVRSALEKVAAKVAKTVATSKSVKVAAKPGKVKVEKIEKPVPAAKVAKGAKTSKHTTEKLPAKKDVAVQAHIEKPTKAEGKKSASKQESEAGTAKKSLSAKDRLKCREPGCESEGVLSNYCRLHYIKNWKRIKKKESILSTGQLDGYVEELVAKYPDKYLDAIENDLASEKEWSKVISDLELGATEEDFVAEEEDAGLPETAGGRRAGTFDDESDDVY